MPKKKIFDYDDDDCPICVALREADLENRELNLKEVKKAFKKAKKKSKLFAEF